MSIYTAGLCASLLVLHQFYSFSRHPLEHIKKFCSRSLRRRFGARSIEYWLYTPSLCASAPGTASTTKILNDALKWL
ncbi:MAG: hypothetical protein K2W99_02610 [Chthoniobacterales bacterium]|nr:hypothetical protein [Chthoniobacterales bacterium]